MGAAEQVTAARRRAGYDRQRIKDVARHPVVEEGGVRVFVVPDSTMTQGTASVAHTTLTNGSTLVDVTLSQATYVTLGYDPEALNDFVKDMRMAPTGMQFLVEDAGSYGRAARAEAKAQGTDVPASRERIELLHEELEALVLQAAGLNRTPSLVQLEMFSVRYADLQQRYNALVQEMEKIDGLLSLAATAIADAAA